MCVKSSSQSGLRVSTGHGSSGPHSLILTHHNRRRGSPLSQGGTVAEMLAMSSLCFFVCVTFCTSQPLRPTMHIYIILYIYTHIYMHVCILSGVHSGNLAGVHLCKIKSMSAGSHSDKINRTWHFLRRRQMLAPLPSEHFPSLRRPPPKLHFVLVWGYFPPLTPPAPSQRCPRH